MRHIADCHLGDNWKDCPACNPVELTKRDRAIRMKKYWAKVRSGQIPKPERKHNAEVRRAIDLRLDGSFGPNAGKRLVVTLHQDGRLDLRPERSRRTITVVLCDVYRFGVRAQAEKARRERVAKRKAAKLARLEGQ